MHPDKSIEEPTDMTERHIIRQWPHADPGLHVAYSNVPAEYVGRCILILTGAARGIVFPCKEEAYKAAGYAINGQIGGYGDALVSMTESNAAIDFETAEDWLFGPS